MLIIEVALFKIQRGGQQMKSLRRWLSGFFSRRRREDFGERSIFKSPPSPEILEKMAEDWGFSPLSPALSDRRRFREIFAETVYFWQERALSDEFIALAHAFDCDGRRDSNWPFFLQSLRLAKANIAGAWIGCGVVLGIIWPLYEAQTSRETHHGLNRMVQALIQSLTKAWINDLGYLVPGVAAIDGWLADELAVVISQYQLFIPEPV